MDLSRKQSGFSLLELITVIILLGILGGLGGLLILQPIEAYDDQVRRQQLVDQGEMALRQIARDVRRALPNSLWVDNDPFGTGDGWAVEMINTIDGARYRDEPGTAYASSSDILAFTPGGDSLFNLLGQFQALPGTGTAPAGSQLVIYPTDTVALYDDANAGANSGVITQALPINLSALNSGSSTEETRIILSANHSFDFQSPQQRLFVVDGPISYVCDPATGQIIRYDGYDYQDGSSQPTPLGAVFATGNTGLVVSRLGDCDINYDPGTPQRAGVLSISIAIDDSGETINLLHQIHVINVP